MLHEYARKQNQIVEERSNGNNLSNEVMCFHHLKNRFLFFFYFPPFCVMCIHMFENVP
jgi:hypothetical protein